MLILHSYNLPRVNPLFSLISGINQQGRERWRIHGILEMDSLQRPKIHPPPITQREPILLNSQYKAILAAAAQLLKTLSSPVKQLTLHLPPVSALVKRSAFKIIRLLLLFRP